MSYLKSAIIALIFILMFVSSVSADSINAKVVSNTYIQKSTANSTWATLHDATTGNNAYTSLQYMRITSDNQTDRFYDITRWGACYDTTSIPSTGNVTKVSLWWRSSAKANGLGAIPANVTTFSPASVLAVNAVANYNKFGTTSLAGINYADVSTSTYNVQSISDLTIVNKTGHTCLGIRLQSDLNNTAPPWIIGRVVSSYRPQVMSSDIYATFLEVDYDTSSPSSSGGTAYLVEQTPLNSAIPLMAVAAVMMLYMIRRKP